MATKRPTMRELSDARNRKRLEEMHAAIREGTLTVRQMTPRERKDAEERRDAVARTRSARPQRRR